MGDHSVFSFTPSRPAVGLEAREKAAEDLSRQVGELQAENRTLASREEAARESGDRVRELERENFELVQQMAIDKKALSDLREELVDEKIKKQKLANELELVRALFRMIVIGHQFASVVQETRMIAREPSAVNNFSLFCTEIESEIDFLCLKVKTQKSMQERLGQVFKVVLFFSETVCISLETVSHSCFKFLRLRRS